MWLVQQEFLTAHAHTSVWHKCVLDGKCQKCEIITPGLKGQGVRESEYPEYVCVCV